MWYKKAIKEEEHSRFEICGFFLNVFIGCLVVQLQLVKLISCEHVKREGGWEIRHIRGESILCAQTLQASVPCRVRVLPGRGDWARARSMQSYQTFKSTAAESVEFTLR